jgi:hypothetical protein
MLLQNFNVCLQDYMVSQPRRPLFPEFPKSIQALSNHTAHARYPYVIGFHLKSKKSVPHCSALWHFAIELRSTLSSKGVKFMWWYKLPYSFTEPLSYFCYINTWPPLWSSGQSFWLQIQRSQGRFPALPDVLINRGSETGSTQPREDNWGATWIKK